MEPHPRKVSGLRNSPRRQHSQPQQHCLLLVACPRVPRALADQVPNNNVTGFAKEMDATVVQQLVEEVTKRTLEALQHQSGDQSMPDTANLSEEDDLPVSWGEVIQPRTVEPSTAEAQRLIKLLANAPPLQDLRSQVTTIPLYSGVPETPATRRNKVDNGLYQVQHKVEYAMHLLVKSVDGGDVASMIQATVWDKSCSSQVLGKIPGSRQCLVLRAPSLFLPCQTVCSWEYKSYGLRTR
jgi:hypothetical protein